ncbi:hypothetical protein PbB2_02856 [Candidatus Phycosocius bacilliformis]|uniref:Uncharacterized protein n=1 Tax=Candidatus Phycosocius bacilliformis TaxID=1445552 RepID=A0A2P2EDM9_9PROT|nr:hypothetical protein [Candidatus Phycosocius bacilliformis]GBF59164.1 hypothetical protein PbB2_02856 [Candidatus Phycosocius bacilliformis]
MERLTSTTKTLVSRTWVVELPFNGFTKSFVRHFSDGSITVGYGDVTYEELLTKLGDNLKIVSDDELEAMMDAHEQSLFTTPTAISQEKWDEMLCVLPPARWTRGRVELFHINEHLSGSAVDWYGHINGSYYTWTQSCGASTKDMEDLVLEAHKKASSIQVT